MKIIDWNISYAGDTERKIKYLQTHIEDDTCVILQEVKPHAYEYIKATLSNKYELFYSLEYRKPSKFDSDARRLGVLVMVSKDFEILEAGVIERSPFPDRTVYVTLKKNDKTIKMLALHSLTGCGYYRSKSVQYDSFAEFIDEYRPDIIGIDANEPQVDHYDMTQMQFFDNGPGAKHFFDEMVDIGLTDAYVRFNGIEGSVIPRFTDLQHLAHFLYSVFFPISHDKSVPFTCLYFFRVFMFNKLNRKKPVHPSISH